MRKWHCRALASLMLLAGIAVVTVQGLRLLLIDEPPVSRLVRRSADPLWHTLPAAESAR